MSESLDLVRKVGQQEITAKAQVKSLTAHSVSNSFYNGATLKCILQAKRYT
jgi:hypothetical protein